MFFTSIPPPFNDREVCLQQIKITEKYKKG